MNPSSPSLKQLVEFIAKSLVNYPDQVHVRESGGHRSLLLELEVAKEDLGKIIGKKGRTVQSIRAVVGAAAAKLNLHVEFEVVE